MVALPPLAEGAPPRVVAALAPVGEATIEETWDPVGLAGTGSHDVHFDDVFVPWHRTFPWPAGIPVSAFPAAVFVPGTWFISHRRRRHPSRAGAPRLDEARNELRGKTDRYTQKPLLENPATQRSLEAAEGLWFACRAGMREALAAMWEMRPARQARDGGAAHQRARCRGHGDAPRARRSCGRPTMPPARARCVAPACCSGCCATRVA